MTKYFVDLDKTLCVQTIPGDYSSSVPIPERMERLRILKENPENHITIWTARGAKSKNNYTCMTVNQLAEWKVPYDVLSFQKPDFDILIDDKAFQVDSLWRKQSSQTKKKKDSPQEIVTKEWGHEIVIVNHDKYCGKILCFKRDFSGSMHYHMRKQETWYIQSGKIMLSCADPATGEIINEILVKGDVVTHYAGEAHQVYAMEDTEIFEMSTYHDDEDTYRIKL